MPSGFATRKTGVKMTDTKVGVARFIRKTPDNKPVYNLAFEDGRTLKAVTGAMVEFEGERYMALGLRGDDFCLMSIKTRKILKFRRQTAK